MNTPDYTVYQELDDRFKFSWVSLMMTGPNAGKRPSENNWQQYCKKRRALNEVDYQWSHGITTGPASGIIVLDVDDIEKFKALGLPVPKTFTVRTGRGGVHYYYRYPSDGQRYGNRSYSNGSGVFDVRGDGGQVVSAGSVHIATGNQYTIIDDSDIADAPQWLLDYSLTGNLGGKVEQSAPAPKTAPAAATMFDWGNSIDRLPIKPETKDLIVNGVDKGQNDRKK